MIKFIVAAASVGTLFAAFAAQNAMLTNTTPVPHTEAPKANAFQAQIQAAAQAEQSRVERLVAIANSPEAKRYAAMGADEFCGKLRGELKKSDYPSDALLAQLPKYRIAVDDLPTIRGGKIRIGFSQCAMVAGWGRPQSANESLNRGGEHVQAVYGLRSYVYLDNGVVTAIQSRS